MVKKVQHFSNDKNTMLHVTIHRERISTKGKKTTNAISSSTLSLMKEFHSLIDITRYDYFFFFLIGKKQIY